MLSILARSALLTAAVFIAAHAVAEENKSQSSPQDADGHIAKLIAQLGDDDYHVRSTARLQLAKIGFDAFDALSAAENHADPEIAGSARYLLRLLQVDFADKNDTPKVKEILNNYRAKSTNEKLVKMRALSELPNAEGLPALCRLVRFERSEPLSKHAAIALLKWQIANPTMVDRLEPLLKARLGNSRRRGAQWLFAALKFSTDPDAATKQWKEFIVSENDLLLLRDPRTNSQVIKELINYDIHWAFAHQRSQEDKVEAFGRLVSLRRNGAESLQELLPWLVEREAWKLVQKNPAEFADIFAVNPRQTMYALAQKLHEQGKAEDAEAAAALAVELDFNNSNRPESSHFQTALSLQRKGHFDWAAREYRRCIEIDDTENEVSLLAHSYLAEMHHDQAQDDKAAAVLKQLVDKLKTIEAKKEDGNAARKAQNLRRRIAGYPEMTVAGQEARRGFFLAEYYKAKGDLDKQREHLEASLAADPTEIDVLIACYRLKDPSPEFREKVKKHISETALRMRTQAIKNPTATTWLNQYAWLVSNTEGDYDEALKFSQKSLQLQRDNGGYYDTLARCYYAKGDLENAVKAQKRASHLEPHSGLIARQLKLFEDELAEKKK